ncbi:MAG: rod-binding protein [Candidatus Krumholzibacteriota bacterium]|nr:rod-binding protein [Candidatus Krumholzibacteriota bacterium]
MKIQMNPQIRPVQAESSGAARTKSLEKAARDFESILIGQFFQLMHSTVSDEGMVEKSFPRKIYEEMMQGEFASEFTKRGGFGLSEVLVDRFNRGQGGEAATVPGALPGNTGREALPLGKKDRFMKIGSENDQNTNSRMISLNEIYKGQKAVDRK